ATLAADIKKDKNDTSENDQTATPSLGDADAYNKAFRLLSRKHFNQAQSAFKNYLQDYPKGQFAVNAHFWLGEIALMNQHYDDAISQFKTVVTQYPTSNKVSDAKLKIAMIHAAKGETDKAKKEFTQIRKDYPGSTAAQLASIRLQQISGGVS
ncbi:MAG: tol system periplasmic component, partial [uncultured bacterium]